MKTTILLAAITALSIYTIYNLNKNSGDGLFKTTKMQTNEFLLFKNKY